MRTHMYTILKLNLLFFLFLFCMPFETIAQERTITGKVTDESDGYGIPGVNVFIKGTSSGTISDLDGNYSLKAGKGDVLVFSSVGYVTKEIPVGEDITINVSLKTDVKGIEEVVVIGYGTQKKDDLTGSVAVVDSEELTKSNPSTMSHALQGKVAGISVTNASGQPGAPTSIKIRGIGSLSSSTDPLFVIDGVLTESKYALSGINPSDIENISVLKDASATAIYGSRGANGVIVITTKKGEKGKTKINFSSYVGVSQIPNQYEIMNADEYAEFTQAAWENYQLESPNASIPLFFTDSARNANNTAETDWFDLITQNGMKQNYNLSLSSGKENLSFMAGFNYYKEEGVLINTGYERISGRINSELKVNKWLTIGENLTFSRNKFDYTSQGTNPWRLATISSPFMPVYDSTNIGGFAGPDEKWTGPNDKPNPYAEQSMNENEQMVDRIIGNFYGEVNLLKGLTYKFEFGLNHNITYDYRYSPKYELARAWDNFSSSLRESYGRNTNILVNNLLTYTNTFGENNMTILLGQSAESTTYRSLFANGSDVAFDKNVMSLSQTILTAGGIETDDRFSSLFARGIYDYAGKYLLTATIRKDGSSRFGSGNRYGYFPSFSAAWKIHEDFLSNVEQIDMLKLRAGWGQTGNANIGSYRYIDRINNPLETRYPFGEDEDIHYGGTIIRSFANPDIKWEATEMTNIGIDANLFSGKLQLTAEYYYKDQKDMLVELEQYHFMGRQQESAKQTVNFGRITNKGFEFNVVYQEMEHALQYSIRANLTTINNEVKELPNDEPLLTNGTYTATGYPVGNFYGWKVEKILQEEDFAESGALIGAKQSGKTRPGDFKFVDINNDSIINSDDQTIIGSPVPDFVYGFNIDLYYKNFDFNIFFEGVHGNEIYNSRFSEIALATEPSTKNWNRLTDVLEYWTPENRSTTMVRPLVTDPNNNARSSDWFVEDGSYLRLKNIQIGYTLNDLFKNNIHSLRLYISASNLFTLTKYEGLDPEINNENPLRSGFDGGNYPVPRSFMTGVQLNF